MAQSAYATKKAAKMVTKEQLDSTNPGDVLDWEVIKVESGLKALDITIGIHWSKSKKVNELFQALKEMNCEKKVESAITGQDSNLMLLQTFQKMKEQSPATQQKMA